MAVLVRITNPGMSLQQYDQIAGKLIPELKKQAGFHSHLIYPQRDGLVVEEVWDTREQQENWFELVRANLPPDARPQMDFVELHNFASP